ncbi:MAG: hypothetical protein L3J39_03070 [Verrucomicrobiales bacterium]|nr:hypothetical protein [Verrucomicrobiales bacterium]
MKKAANYFTRLILLAVLAAGLVLILRPARDQVRLEQLSKQTLLILQTSLQNYHVEEEAYPPQSPMSGAQLIRFLIADKHLPKPPLNPVTLQPYDLSEQRQTDRIVYTTDELAETYSLQILQANSQQSLWIVDSTEHQSLETAD